ncbi:MAG: DUF5060 domain-containing protein [Verrucomicrobia bacterium]|nr:DUF5060 domain-containing protein [Verrucomicrobiota bacterium]
MNTMPILTSAARRKVTASTAITWFAIVGIVFQFAIQPGSFAQQPSAKKDFPAHWGSPPRIQTRDYILLPEGYGRGSSTLSKWISTNLEADRSRTQPLSPNRQSDGGGSVEISGELKRWHKVTLTLDGPFAHEHDSDPNPFTDRRMTVAFTHETGSPNYQVPGYFAADGMAANSSAKSGTKWRAHLSPDKSGKWTYRITFTTGNHAALNPETPGETLSAFNNKTGTFEIAESNKSGRDFRGKGRLQYVGKQYLQFAGSGEFFLKAGPDAPETLLAYQDFDDTVALKKNVPLKSWETHVADWQPGDPTWKNGKGKGLIGALNYLAAKGVNAFSFLPYNAGGDGDNVWPFVERNDKFHYDCSKLDQWQIVFDHATALGLYLHFKLQENEIDDNRQGDKLETSEIRESLDGGLLGPERKLYCRELIARFAHELALNWNLGEENTQSTAEQIDMARYLRDTDPYDHHIVVHTFPSQQDKVYPPLLGTDKPFTGASLQNGWNNAHQRTLKWVTASVASGKPWVVANDEQNPATMGVPPDPEFEGHSGFGVQDGKNYNLDDIRKQTLWGTLMAGGAGVEYYFGYQLPQNDLNCQNWRSRDRSWDYCRNAIEFFHKERIPFAEMKNANALIGNASNDNSKYCFAKTDQIYLIYLPNGGGTNLDLSDAKGRFRVRWFNPRNGGDPQQSFVLRVLGGGNVSTGEPPSEPTSDWLAIVSKIDPFNPQ